MNFIRIVTFWVLKAIQIHETNLYIKVGDLKNNINYFPN